MNDLQSAKSYKQDDLAGCLAKICSAKILSVGAIPHLSNSSTIVESDKWSQLHDIALLYLCCMHGTDAEIDPSETELVQKLLLERSSDAGAASKVMDDVMLMYVGRAGADMLAASIASLSHSMTDDDRLQILQELANIASADGLVYPNEVEFIVGVAKQWGLESFLSAD